MASTLYDDQLPIKLTIWASANIDKEKMTTELKTVEFSDDLKTIVDILGKYFHKDFCDLYAILNKYWSLFTSNMQHHQMKSLDDIISLRQQTYLIDWIDCNGVKYNSDGIFCLPLIAQVPYIIFLVHFNGLCMGCFDYYYEVDELFYNEFLFFYNYFKQLQNLDSFVINNIKFAYSKDFLMNYIVNLRWNVPCKKNELETKPRFRQHILGNLYNIMSFSMSVDLVLFLKFRKQHNLAAVDRVHNGTLFNNKQRLNLTITGTACCGKTTLVNTLLDKMSDLRRVKAGSCGKFQGKDTNISLAVDYNTTMLAYVYDKKKILIERSFLDNLLWRYIQNSFTLENANKLAEFIDHLSENTFALAATHPMLIIVDFNVENVKRRMIKRGFQNQYGDILRSQVDNYVQLQNAYYIILAYLTNSPIILYDELIENGKLLINTLVNAINNRDDAVLCTSMETDPFHYTPATLNMTFNYAKKYNFMK